MLLSSLGYIAEPRHNYVNVSFAYRSQPARGWLPGKEESYSGGEGVVCLAPSLAPSSPSSGTALQHRVPRDLAWEVTGERHKGLWSSTGL